MIDLEKSRAKALQKIQATALFDAIAAQSAKNNEPASKAARATYWQELDLIDAKRSLIDDKKKEIEKWEAMPEPLPSEALRKERRLAVLRGELDALGVMLDAPAQPVAGTAPPKSQAETKEQRQDRRLQACIDDGLEMLTKSALLRLPDGVGRLADIEGVKRQSFSIDIKAAQKRRVNAVKNGGQ